MEQHPVATLFSKYFKKYEQFMNTVYDGFDEDPMSIRSRCRFQFSELNDTPYSKGEVKLAGWNSAQDSKRGGNPMFQHLDEDEDEEELIECDFCSNTEVRDEMIPFGDRLACPHCRDREDEEEDEFNEECENCGKKMSDIKLSEEEFDEHPDREIGYDEDSQWHCKGCREEAEEPCDRCPSKSMNWCQSNGCPRESEDEEEEDDRYVYCTNCNEKVDCHYGGNIFCLSKNEDEQTICHHCHDQFKEKYIKDGWKCDDWEEEEEWNSETEWDQKPTPPCWWHLLKEIEKHRKKEEKPKKKKKKFIIKKKK